jgi:hypothetical protein
MANELLAALCIILILSILLKVWDLYSPLTFASITTPIAFCGVGFIVYAVSRALRKGSLFEAAVSLDERAHLSEGVTTSTWFIHSGESSRWIDAQIADTARNAGRIDIRRLYPRAIPRVSYGAALLVVLFIGLNFVPLSLNHNWLRFQAAAAGVPPQPAEMVDPMEEQINEGLKEIASEFAKSAQTNEAAKALRESELERAAEELRRLSKLMDDDQTGSTQSSGQMAELQKTLEQASQHPRPGLEQLSQDLATASQGLKKQDRETTQQGLDGAAKELEKLGQKMRSQQSRASNSKSRQPQEGEDELAKFRRGEDGRSQQPSDAKSDSESDGTGENPAGTPPQHGDRTSLEVQLEQERLSGMPNAGGIPEEVHESSKQQSSRLEYSNIQSELRAGRKDLMNQDGIPWEYRSLVKDYLQAIRP